MRKISNKLTQVKARIQKSAALAGRNPQEITLLAVSKRQNHLAIHEAYLAGQHHFGENYLQEALTKIEELPYEDIVWHFIGPIQSNKTRQIAENFSWVHSVDRLKVAKRLNDQRQASLPKLNVCLQINIDNEDTKSGISRDEAMGLALEINTLPRLQLRGLMCIPAKDDKSTAFSRMNALYSTLKSTAALAHLDTLSMGMSTDLEAAVHEGATLVRIGTDIFGKR